MSNLELEISCQAVSELLNSDIEFTLIDCREQEEHDKVHIPQAVLIPMSELPQRVSDLGSDLQKRLIVHCHHGGRSLRVAQWLREQGFEQSQSMAGGIDRWAIEIAPGMPRYQ